MGIFLKGVFLQLDTFTNEDGTFRYAVSIAIGRYAYLVYMAESDDVELLHDYSVGDNISISARPYVGKNGKLGWSDGKIA